MFSASHILGPISAYKHVLITHLKRLIFVHIGFVVLFADCKVIFALLSGTLPFAAKTELDPKTKVSIVHPASGTTILNH